MKKANPTPTTTEILEVLISYYFLKHINLQPDQPLEKLKSLKLISLLTDDIILRLCKLGDTDNRTASFSQVGKQVKRDIQPVRNNGIDVRIARYVQRTKNLRNHRNWRITHLSTQDKATMTPHVELYDVVREAVELWDEMSGTVNEYRLLDVDLREAVLKFSPF